MPAFDPSLITLADLEADPHPILADLRAHAPVSLIPSLEMWLVTRWDDVVFVCEHPELFTASTNPSWLRECLGENMLTLDGEAHDLLANGMRPPFAGTPTGRETASSFPDMFDDIIDGFADLGTVDIMAAYAEPLANLTLLHALGFTSIEWEQLARWCRGVITGLANFENDPDKTEIAAAAHAELGVALENQLAQTSEREVDGGLSAYLRHGFSDDEIVNNVRLMISGGINEPRDAVGLVLFELLSDPDLMDRVIDDGSLLRKVIEETLRFHSPVGTSTRQATEDVELGGATIPAGAMVAAVLTSANRDPGRWSDPDTFDIDRGQGAHLAFATGEHRCLGEWMARQQVRTGVERLLERLPAVRLDGPVELHGFEFRGPRALPIAWG